MSFRSPSKGPLSMEALFQDIKAYMEEEPGADYRVIVGSDSHTRDSICFVTAIIVHRQGKGGRYYYRKTTQRKITSLRQKIFYETSLSLAVAQKIATFLAESHSSHFNVEIHLDVGEKGSTKELIREIVGMVTGSGFDAKIKPHSYGASTVADRHSK